MKAITVKQPWASLIVEGIKDIENRTWKTNFRGHVLIHAAAKPIDKFSTCLNRAQTIDFQNKSNIPFDYNKNLWVYNQMEFACNYEIGLIIGSVEIVDCVINHPSIWAEKSNWYNQSNPNGLSAEYGFKHTNKKDNPIYNWVLANPIKFPESIPCKGKLSFWESQFEILKCPKCGQYCLHDNHDIGVPNWGNPTHICEHCIYAILESEFEFLK